jgi:RNA polymerase sigma factor for flagellar operon FliA
LTDHTDTRTTTVSSHSGAIQTYQRVADQSRRDELILSHLPLVKHIIGRLAAELPPGVDVDNLESAGVLGLVEAAGKYDPTRNAQFKTFAYIRIRGSILDELRRNSPLPQHMMERITLVRKAYRTFSGPVTVETLSAATGLTVDEVTDALSAERFNKMISWEQTAVPNGMTAVNAAPPPEAETERWEAVQQLADAIEELPPRERMAVTLYYREEMRLKEMSEVMRLSPSRISRILSRAIFDLGERLRLKGVDGGYAMSAMVG